MPRRDNPYLYALSLEIEPGIYIGRKFSFIYKKVVPRLPVKPLSDKGKPVRGALYEGDLSGLGINKPGAVFSDPDYPFRPLRVMECAAFGRFSQESLYRRLHPERDRRHTRMVEVDVFFGYGEFFSV